ncbi:hypothetical protein ACFX12_010105 [Malus domestica]
MPIRVADLIDSDMGAWKSILVRTWFDEEESKIILGLPVSVAGCMDRLIWHYSADDAYTVRTRYGVAMEMQTNWGGGVVTGMMGIIVGGIFGD